MYRIIICFILLFFFSLKVYSSAVLPKDFDYTFKSIDENLNLNLTFITDGFCKDINLYQLNVSKFQYEQQNIINTLNFLESTYFEFLDKEKEGVIFLELLVLNSLLSHKYQILKECKFTIDKDDLQHDRFFYNYFKILAPIFHDLPVLKENINYLHKIFLSSSDKVLEVIVADSTFNEFNIDQVKIIIDERKSKNRKFIIDWGDYYALMIGNNDYNDKNYSDLDSPINDIDLITNTLVSKYNFKKDNIKLLKNATRSDILETLFEYREIDKYNNNKNLLIYYAGHGEVDQIDPNNLQGYWLPVDAKYSMKSTWISNDTIRRELSALPFKHIIIIADSCFSGTLTSFKSSIKTIPKNMSARQKFLENKNKLFARVALTSGNIDEVPDTIDNNLNSPFAISLNNSLIRNDDILLSSKLHDEIIEEIQYSGFLQDPTYGGIINSKHSPGGNFIFVPSF